MACHVIEDKETVERQVNPLLIYYYDVDMVSVPGILLVAILICSAECIIPQLTLAHWVVRYLYQKNLYKGVAPCCDTVLLVPLGLGTSLVHMQPKKWQLFEPVLLMDRWITRLILYPGFWKYFLITELSSRMFQTFGKIGRWKLWYRVLYEDKGIPRSCQTDDEVPSKPRAVIICVVVSHYCLKEEYNSKLEILLRSVLVPSSAQRQWILYRRNLFDTLLQPAWQILLVVMNCVTQNSAMNRAFILMKSWIYLGLSVV